MKNRYNQYLSVAMMLIAGNASVVYGDGAELRPRSLRGPVSPTVTPNSARFSALQGPVSPAYKMLVVIAAKK